MMIRSCHFDHVHHSDHGNHGDNVMLNVDHVIVIIDHVILMISSWGSYHGDHVTMLMVNLAIIIMLSSQSCPQVFVCCHYCGKSISPWYKGMPKGGQTGSLSRQGGAGGNKPKVQACPHCKVSCQLQSVICYCQAQHSNVDKE